MGYACPVCETPQADGEHLANHLAFTAMLHGGPHEEWLTAHVPDWTNRDPGGLAAAVVGHAEEVAQETVFEDTTGGRPEVGLGQGHRGPEGPRELDPEARRILEEALEMTRARRGSESDDDEG